MKKLSFLVIVALLAVLSCQKNDSTSFTPSRNVTPSSNQGSIAPFMRETSGPYSQYISVDTANKMIESYLQSINSSNNDTDIRAFIFNADTLRSYLTNHPNVKQLKFMFAHTLNYINAGNYGVNAGYQSGAMTLIVIGYDGNNNYIYNTTGEVLEHAMPCPSICPSGTAGSYTLQ